MSYINRLSTKVKLGLSIPVASAMLNHRADDSFVVAYPRSGSTWLRTMLTNLLVPTANGNPDVFNHVIPGVSIRNLPELYRLPSPRLISSHTGYRPELERVVYVVRDGRDVLTSYYHYLFSRTQVKEHKVPFAEYFSRYLAGDYGFWHKHVEGWLVNGKSAYGDNLHIVQYSQLRKQTELELERVVKFLKIPFDRETLALAIEQATLEHARKIEQLREGPILEKSNSFYREGSNGKWHADFSETRQREFENLSENALNLLSAQSS